MRFAPPKRLRIADRASGLNQVSVRSYNERLVLSLLLQNQGISRMEIGQITGLSAQTISVIVRSLEQEGLVAKGEAQRGRVGPPTIPMSLNPDGAYSVGVSIGYRKTEVVLIDFVGTSHHYSSFHYTTPDLDDIHTRLLKIVEEVLKTLPPAFLGRVAGIGVAVPSDIETWTIAAHGRGLQGIERELESLTGLQVFLQNDITAAAGGESMFGIAKTMTDYLYFYLGARLHKRLILNHRIHNGRLMTVRPNFDFGVLQLENELLAKGISSEGLWHDSAGWENYGTILDEWRVECSLQLQHAIDALSQFVDVDTVVLSSFAPRQVVEWLCADLQGRFQGLKVLPSSIPVGAKPVGAASLPFSSRFMVQ